MKPAINAIKAKSILSRPAMSADSVALEIFFVRFPPGSAEANGPLWHQIDEQHFPADLRRRWHGQGFRAGIVSGQLPVALTRLLELNGKPTATANTERTQVDDLTQESDVQRRHLQIRAGQRSEIVTSEIYDRLPVLTCGAEGLTGETYRHAQTKMAVKTYPQGDGRVRIELVPEIHHDESRQRFVGGQQGMWRLEAGQPRRSFDELKLTATLSPGGMLVLTSLPQRPGSLGHHFFTENEDRPEQKLLLIRLAQTQQDDLFSPPQVLELPE